MPKDILKEFVASQQSLIKEKQVIENRLRDINAALGSEASLATVAQPVAKREQRKALSKRLSNSLSLREAVSKVLSSGPKTKQDILEGVKKLGYRFGGKDPMNSLGVILYGKPKFKNVDGKFSAPK